MTKKLRNFFRGSSIIFSIFPPENNTSLEKFDKYTATISKKNKTSIASSFNSVGGYMRRAINKGI